MKPTTFFHFSFIFATFILFHLRRDRDSIILCLKFITTELYIKAYCTDIDIEVGLVHSARQYDISQTTK